MKAKRVILHCSATSDSGDRYGAQDIDEWHRAKGWYGIGYHRVVRRSGVDERGRPDHVEGAHCKGHNEDSIGICYVGTKYPTTEQIRTILNLYQEYKSKYQINWSNWFGHYELANTKCPGFSLDMLRLFLAQFDDGQFDVDSTDQIKTFLQVASFGEKEK